MDWKVKVHWDTMGITQRSLKALRDEIITRVRNKISVYEYPTDTFCCGYLIVDHTTRDIAVIGNGFRTDGSGEGGAGYKSAQCLFHLFGLVAYPLEIPVPYLPFPRSDGEREMLRETYKRRLLKSLQDEYIFDDESRVPLDKDPEYCRYKVGKE